MTSRIKRAKLGRSTLTWRVGFLNDLCFTHSHIRDSFFFAFKHSVLEHNIVQDERKAWRVTKLHHQEEFSHCRRCRDLVGTHFRQCLDRCKSLLVAHCAADKHSRKRKKPNANQWRIGCLDALVFERKLKLHIPLSIFHF